SAYFILAWAVVWLTLVWFLLTLGGHALEWPAIFPIIPGLVAGYVAAARFVNSTTITADAKQFTVRHGPLPWLGGKTIPTDDLQEFSCEERVTYAKQGPVRSYRIWYLCRSGKRGILLSRLESPADQAVFIAQTLQSQL